MAGISSKAAGSLENRRKFNGGTERNTDLDINLDETNFRLYDSQIGRFLQIDALDGLSVSISPYSYANDNPISLNDPLGLLSTKENPEVLPDVTVIHKKQRPLVGFSWPAYTKNDVKKWDNLRSEYNKLRDNGKVPTDAKFKPYQKSFAQSYQANKEWKTNSIAAVLLLGSPILATVSPSVFAGSIYTRLAASSSDFTIQYALNVGQYGLGKDNLLNINVSSIIGNGIAPGSSFTSSLIGTSFATSLSGGYVGIGNTTVSNFGVSVGLGYTGNLLGSSLEGLAEKYVNSGAFLNNFSGNIFGNTVSGTGQIIYSAATQ
jgi:RHS repeat-associated protein